MFKKLFLLVFIISLSLINISCKSKSNIPLNIDKNATPPILKNNTYQLTKHATNNRYGYDENYPVNLGFNNIVEKIDVKQYFNALAGPNNEELRYTFMESCCPFMTKSGELGTGVIDKYEITWKGKNKPTYMYVNLYEKGEILIPIGLTAKQ